MDNISHTLAGVLAAEALLAVRSAKGSGFTPQLAKVAWVSSALANNLPDLDFAYTLITPGKVGYLLHHRGHTHTVALAVPLALLLLGVLGWLARRQRWRLSRADWLTLCALVLGGPFLHLALDATNNYGVHPFWPVDNRWFYGDTIFIIEPLFWLCAVPLVLHVVRTRVARGLWALVLAIALVACWALPAVPWSHAALGTALAAGVWLSSRRLAPLPRVAVPVTLSALVFLSFLAAGRAARASLKAQVARDYPGWTLRDAVLTPLPANPLCWEALTVMTRGEERYSLLRAQVAVAPALRAAPQCPLFSLAQRGTAPLRPSTGGGSAAVRWRDGLELPLSDLKAVIAQSCEASAFLRFARAPFLLEPEGARPVLGDLRYDREPALSFAELELQPDAPCPRFIPPWTPPRAELLSPGTEGGGESRVEDAGAP